MQLRVSDSYMRAYAMSEESRTRGIDLHDEEALTLFRSHLPLGQVHPKHLWRVEKISKKQQTSDWNAMQKAFQFLSALLDTTGGRIPKIASFAGQLGKFLRSHNTEWSATDLENAVERLRSMLSKLLQLPVRET